VGPSCTRVILLLFFFFAPLLTLSAETLDPPPQGEGSARAETAETPAADSEEAPRKRPLEWKFYWHECLHFWLQQEAPVVPHPSPVPERLRPRPRLEGRVGVRLHVDAAAFAGDEAFEGFTNDIELRRLRILTRGSFSLWVPVYFKFQLGITKDQFFVNDGFLEFRKIPLIQTFAFGVLKAPFSMERLESGRDTAFLERASVVEAFAPGFKPGFQIAGNQFKNRMLWAAGYFAEGQDADIGDVTSSNFRLVGRVSGLLFHDTDYGTNRLMHLGASYSFVKTSDGSARYRSRPECFVAPRVVDTEDIPADTVNLIGAEVAFVMNSLCFQGEYIHSFVDPKVGDDLQFSGYYAYVTYFPTGETRPYDTTLGVLRRVRPKQPFSFKNRTYGGLQIQARYSHLDLNGGPVQGGRVNIVSAGVTWYLFPVFKLLFNYGYADIDNREGDDGVHIFQTRIGVEFS
jgi:phosphate-selective porin OprO/OprP